MTEDNFKRNIKSFKQQYQHAIIDLRSIKLKQNSINLTISDGKYISQQLIDLIEHCLIITDPTRGRG